MDLYHFVFDRAATTVMEHHDQKQTGKKKAYLM